MKRILFVALLAISFYPCFGQQPYNVAFDLTSKDSTDHKMVLRWLKEIPEDNPKAKLEVVLYGQSLGMVTKESSVVADEIRSVLLNPNISIVVCAVAMKHNHITKEHLLPGVRIVPDGIYELLLKQKQGWAYIKAAR
jgi:uncharacterized protein